MQRTRDLTGMKFGKLTVLQRGDDYIAPSGKHRARWLCQCECGGTSLTQTGTLLHGKARSCGCMARELASDRMKHQQYSAVDITGQKFGRLTAIKPVSHVPNDGIIWLCECECGNTAEVPAKMLRSENTKSCGCLRDDKISKVNLIHGKSHKSRLYNVWVGMRQRCNDPNHRSYANYGGRGIRVCAEWDDFAAFESWALSHGYDAHADYGQCTLDRINVNGNYEPNNCRWVDSKTQAANKRRPH